MCECGYFNFDGYPEYCLKCGLKLPIYPKPEDFVYFMTLTMLSALTHSYMPSVIKLF